MSNAVVKTSKIIKSATSDVRTHFDVFDRARDLYLSQIKKAEFDYFARIRRATAVIAGDAEAEASAPQQEVTN